VSIPLYDGIVPYEVIEGYGETGFYARFAEEFWPETYFYMDGDDLVIGVDSIFTDEVFEITVEDYEPGDLGLEFIPYPHSQTTLLAATTTPSGAFSTTAASPSCRSRRSTRRPGRRARA
jgi:hypothetical protein